MTEFMLIKDFKGRMYSLIETTATGTLLQDCKDGSRVRIRNTGWDEIGFEVFR